MKASFQLAGYTMLALVFLASCTKFSQTKKYTANTPVYMTYDDLRSSIKNDNDKSLERPGKIFLYNQYIMVNDYVNGVHIYDHSVPGSPSHLAFINAPGMVDMAVKDNVLYLDSYVDLVAVDISNPADVKEIGREKNALSYTIPSIMDYSYPVSQIDPEKGVVVGYEVKEIEETCENDECGYMYYNAVAINQGDWDGNLITEEGTVVNFAGSANNVRSMTGSTTQGAVAGSMARFLLIEDYLYVISDESTVKVFQVTDGSFELKTTFEPWSDGGGFGMIETLYRLKDHLLIGSSNGMLAYNISNPSSPAYVSSYTHVTACDPVVANDQYAFVTLRTGSNCGNFNGVEQLDVLSIEDLFNPELITSYPLSNPHGLALDSDNNRLFICDGADGLKTLDISNINRLNIMDQQTGDAYDVIAHGGLLYVIGDDGLVIYQYTANATPTKVGGISLN